MTQKSGNYFGKVPKDSHGRAGKANSQAIWQRIHPKDVNMGSCDLRELDFSPVDDVFVLSESADTNQEMAKVPKSSGCGADSRTGTSTNMVRYQKKNAQRVSSQPYLNPQASSYYMEARRDVPIAVSSLDGQKVDHKSNLTRCQPPISSSLKVEISEGRNSDNIKALPGVAQLKNSRNCNTCAPEEDRKSSHASMFLSPGDKSPAFCGVQNDLRNIGRAISEAHKAQLASESIAMGEGYPVADFEKLVHAASPVICSSVNIRTCQACFHGQHTPLCRHEIPNIPLGNLWRWYERHGSYGLEVRAEDHGSSNRYGIDRIKFRAYFVPFLSAVQLFKYHNRINQISESSPKVDLRSIFSILVPQPRVAGSSSLPKRNDVSDSRSSSECSDTDDNVELVFEYFECEQPQSRKPLFEKIQELVAGNGASSCEAYGDLSILQSAHLPDLHPYSWFSVAWYPIYQIPNGNLRAAFLTYHSLGHYVDRGQTLDAPNTKACVVSPTVGLQSYNAQGECWFVPRMDHLKEVPSDLDPASVLQDRLNTLKQTASAMSRAVRRINGKETVVNRHSDYEFFLSRRT